MAAPGTYDVYVAMKERLPEKRAEGAVAKMGVLKTQVDGAGLLERRARTSSVIVTDKVNVLTAAPSPEEGARAAVRVRRAGADSGGGRGSS